MIEERARQILRSFAEMLEYPEPDLASSVRSCEALLLPDHPEASVQVGQFGRFVEGTPFGAVEEAFSGAFDLDAACYPYVGYHLFGESYKRSVFMLGLKDCYRTVAFVPAGNDLPDHLATVLRFLALCDDAAVAEEMIQDAVLPCLRQMIGKEDDEAPDGEAGQPPPRGRIVYHHVLLALRSYLTALAVSGAQLVETADSRAD